MIPPKEFIKKIRPFSFLSEEEISILMSGLEVDQFAAGPAQSMRKVRSAGSLT